jgi:lipoyl-dependent peroxiredoxin
MPMMVPSKVFYTATAHSQGGRNGQVETEDGVVKHALSLPSAIAGTHKEGTTTPEDLFAAGYAACFGGAVDFFARQQKVDGSGAIVTVKAGIGNVETGWGLTVDITVKLPNAADRAAAQKVLDLAHAGCPYSNATRGNIPVTVTLVD